MIVEIRVDDRLIHGQVALVWTKKLNAKAIVVANDHASKDHIQQMTLKMATPENVKLAIKSMQDAVQLINNPKAKDMRIFVLVNSICDALFLSENIDDIERINIANVGRFDGVDEAEKCKLSSTILLSKSEQVALEQLLASNRKVVHQIVPDNAEKLFHDLMNN
ncbi:PTS sugar transporter subunit IIB [Gilliamella apis]|uniref:PTS sugar transporter subunit IIB n=1 Tax=Gilliamella apis TaxID=1970738 RepID=UPI0004D6334F|nr:PTS sugar transporter subunit IIB [Gilliamella apis]KES16107.1 Phosphotransferase system, mannose/fructose/N-acetylgalactosamine-specific component IIB [Gilliamella apis SCGC AB-598-P17]OTQ81110.1 PTS mannose/fructose/sorbose transporter subunit IIB [Gilliamella apis]